MLYLTSWQLKSLENGTANRSQLEKLSKQNKREIEKNKKASDRSQARYIRSNFKHFIKKPYICEIQDTPMPKAFYSSAAWRNLRDVALMVYGNKCAKCSDVNISRKTHVDHIYPTSTHPEWRLLLTNTQILCHWCNEAKGSKAKDYRVDRQKNRAKKCCIIKHRE